MKKKTTTIKCVYEDLFSADFVMILCEWKDLKKHIKEPLSKEHYEEMCKIIDEHGERKSTLAVTFPQDGGGSIIWFNPKAGLGTYVHELTHASHHLLKKREIPLSDDTEEVYAYLIDFLFKAFVLAK